ncbi:hypothetical protein D3C71_1836880 [compost metagenome]
MFSAAPRSSTSRNPWIEVSGVRSSCEASAAKRRICSLASRSFRKEDSSRSSIALNEWDSWSISVCPWETGNRTSRLPASMTWAVLPMLDKGESARLMEGR